jgi:predicted DNA-binding transcriptional regulator AlpA
MIVEDTSHKRRQHRYADTRSTAQYMGMSEAFLEKARITGEPKIPYVKVGRAVRYDLDEIDALMAARARFNTSEAA